MDNMFTRTEMLIGKDNIDKLKKCHIAVFGVGGVGTYAVEALIRAGIGEITIVDKDVVSITNLNRQLIALNSTVGKNKVDVIEERIKDINSDCKVNKYNVFYKEDNSDDFDYKKFDYIIDAIDTVSSKIELIRKAKENNIKIISCLGTGNKFHPELLKVSDIYDTSVCPLARTMRKLCRDNNITDLEVVYSLEEAAKTNIFENGKAVPGSISYVPSSAGLLIASVVVNKIIDR